MPLSSVEERLCASYRAQPVQGAVDPRQSDRPLIVGAGPVGLGAALFLAKQGRRVRLIDLLDRPAQQSRALAVNPRTMEILQPTGVTARMLEMGSPVHGVRFHRRGRVIAAVSFAGIHARHPFMLALSQATTERLLTEAFENLGGRIERGLKMIECRPIDDDHVEVALEPTAGRGNREIVSCPWMLAAEGAHSIARQQLNIEFVGSSLPHDWYLADVPMRTSLEPDHVHIFFVDGGGFLFCLPVVHDRREKQPQGEQIWRVMGTRPDPLGDLKAIAPVEPAGTPIWTSSFHVAHRVDSAFSRGKVYFAGDAAHIHSPAGARGMNLGLEDAYVFSELVRINRLADYDSLRRPIDEEVVRGLLQLSRMVSAESPIARFNRNVIFPRLLRVRSIRSRMMRTITGLDHPLPSFTALSASAKAAIP